MRELIVAMIIAGVLVLTAISSTIIYLYVKYGKYR